MNTLDSILVVSYEILDRLLECLNLKSLFTLAMVNTSLNNLIITSRKYRFFKLMLRGSSTITVNKINILADDNRQITPLLTIRVDRAFLNYTYYCSPLYSPDLTYNVVKSGNKARRELDRLLQKLNDQYTGEDENETIQLCISFDAGLTFVMDVDVESYAYDSSHEFIDVNVTLAKTNYNRTCFERVEFWTQEWFRAFFPFENCILEDKPLVFKPFVDLSKLKEKYNSNQYYKCYRCNRFTSK